MKRSWILSLLVALLTAATATDGLAKSYYNTAGNQFGGLFPNPSMRMAGRYKAIVEDRLVEENTMMADAVTTDVMDVASTRYRYQLRFANLNNKQGKTKKVMNPMTGQHTTIDSPRWGLVFNGDEEGNYCAVVLSCDNHAPFDDITYQRTMTVSLIQVHASDMRELAHATVTRGVSLEDELNTLCVDVDEGNVRVSIGKEELKQVLDAHVVRPSGAVQVGYLVGPGSRIAIERAVLTIDNENQVAARTSWTLEALDDYLAASTDPIEGYWRYLDRDMEEKWLRLGGRYTLAVVRADDGYDLIYIDGAQVKKSLWQPGMLKGHLARTAFSGSYDLTWIDATLEPMGEDAHASIENGIILTLSFPVYSSQVRLARVLK